MTLEIYKTLVLSTAHITESADRYLAHVLDTQTFDDVKAFEGGWLIRSFTSDDTFDGQDCIKAALAMARENDCLWLCLDRDASTVDSLQKYDW